MTGGPGAEAWERVQALFHAALERPAGERDLFLRGACGSDTALLARVRAMLAADESGGDLLGGGLAAAAGRVLAGEAGSALPRAFGPYRVVGVLGEGGMGVVYRAHRADLESDVAVKVLRDATLSPARRERFAFERRALAQLNHPAIAHLYDAGTLDDGTPWFAMELVEGLPITDHCRVNALSLRDRLRLFRDACEAVQHAHAHAILHRDLKPSNIFVTPDGRVKLLDFGIAKPLEALSDPAARTRTGLRLMTPAYSAPEQVRGVALGVHTDVYSLGVVLYELLAGRLPFDLEGRTPSEAAGILTGQSPRRPSAFATGEQPPVRGTSRSAWSDLDVLCLTAMHPDPARRYPTVDALLREVDRFLAGEALEARGDSFGYRTGKFVRRHAAAVGATALALAVLVTVVTFYTLRLADARDAARAETVRTQRIQGFMTRLFEGYDPEAGVSDTLRVVTLLDHGMREADQLAAEPGVRAELERTLAGAYQGLGRLDRADTLLTHALASSERLPRRDDEGVIRTLEALAILRAEQSRWADAKRLAQRALEMARGLPAPNRALAQATGTLGRVLSNAGSYAEAEPLLLESVRLYSAPGADAGERASTLTDLANTYYYLGRLDESDSLNRIVLAATRARLGDRHPSVADNLINLGAIEDERGRHEQAEGYYRRALDIVRGWYGDDGPQMASLLTMLSQPLIAMQRTGEADSLLRRALAIRRSVFGPRSPYVATTLNEIADLALTRERYAEAESSFKQVVTLYRAAYGPRHGSVGIALANLGSVYMGQHRDRLAEDCFRQSLAAYDGVLPATHTDVGICRIKLGRVLMRQHRYAEAEASSRAGYEILLPQSDPQSGFLRAARKDLAVDYAALGRAADAARFRRELEDTAAARAAVASR
ncbi:MAG: serine/threonine protein kinase [Candidatus Eisenbacteria bacterium]|nr:serine/threonine protein kinase [Candidatus Eisenbacteria bacterium]